ncbi:hypothetical protein E1B28_006393 [Marasmius oreades]|uniref:N-acetyltransferase domain-containing protein n=1 Tax=Marasmius oreades TaxID=181124 RepID=A0A9P7S632_9AGAR|nr:uncharacterized protein E1B28_006393 [Marasmius oreades]KAG7095677.1 hypothetical protein E1B28_006393 [Marasmius oreades]
MYYRVGLSLRSTHPSVVVMSTFSTNHLPNPTEDQITQTVKVFYEAFNRKFFLAALQDPTLVEPLIKSLVRATIVGGQLHVVDSLAGIVGATLCFGPGQRSLGSEEQKQQGFNQLMEKVNKDARRWFTEYFVGLSNYGVVASTSFSCVQVTIMLHDSVDRVHGPGVQDQNYHIQIFGVLPEYQGKGIGKTLLHHIEQKAKSENADVVLETIQPRNVSIYEKLGYEVQGTTEFSHLGIPEPLKCWILRKRLTRPETFEVKSFDKLEFS